MDLYMGTHVSNQMCQERRELANLVHYKSSRHLKSDVKYVKRQRRRRKHTIHPERKVRISLRTNKRPMVLTVLAPPPCERASSGVRISAEHPTGRGKGCAASPRIIGLNKGVMSGADRNDGMARKQRTKGLPNFWLRYIQSILWKRRKSVRLELINGSMGILREGHGTGVPQGAPRDSIYSSP